MRKAAIFDLDGTLYMSGGLPVRLVLARPWAAGTLKAERKARKALMGERMSSEEEFYKRLFGAIASTRGISVERARRWYMDGYMKDMVRILRRHYHAREGLRDFLAGLRRRGYLLAVLSDYSCAREKMEALGIAPDWFDGIFEAPSSGGLKPCADTFLNVCRALGAEPSESVMTGDREDTDGGARAAGLRFVKVEKKLPVNFGELLDSEDFA